MGAINKKQLQIIHIAKKQMEIDDETYQETLATKFGVKSSKELTYFQATQFIDFLKSKGFKLKRKKNTITQGGKVVVIASAQQLALIQVLKSNILWKTENGYQNWLTTRMKIKKVLTATDAKKVIEGLKGMLKINTEIIIMQALPFPFQPDKKLFNKQNYAWFFDMKEKRLKCFTVCGDEICKTSVNT